MDSYLSNGLYLLAVAVLVLLNGFFVAAEFALVSVRKTRIEQLAQEGNRRAKGVLNALEHLDTYIASTQLGITMASLALGFIGEPAVAELLQPLLAKLLPARGAYITAHGVAVAFGFIIVTSVHIIFGELVPKSIALQRSDGTTLRLTIFLDIFMRLFRPFIRLLNFSGNFVLRSMGLKALGGHAAVHSVDELELLVHSTREAGLLEEQQERMVTGVFDFEETVVRKLMTPRPDITAIEADSSAEDLIRVVTDSGHSRIPVYDDTLDNMVGVVHIKDVLRDIADGRMDASIREIMRPPYFVPENKRAGFLLAEMRRSKMQLAVVRDEYGVVSGIVTIEDLLEEIVGDIHDEYDVVETLWTQVSDHCWIVDGSVLLDDFNERMATELPTEDYDTLGGFVFSQVGHQPVKDETAVWNGIRYQIEETDGKRIQKVRVLREHQTEGEEVTVPTSEEEANE